MISRERVEIMISHFSDFANFTYVEFHASVAAGMPRLPPERLMRAALRGNVFERAYRNDDFSFSDFANFTCVEFHAPAAAGMPRLPPERLMRAAFRCDDFERAYRNDDFSFF